MEVNAQAVSHQAAKFLPDAVRKTEFFAKQEATNDSEPVYKPVFKTESVQQAVDAINSALNVMEKDVNLKIHPETNRVIVQIIDAETNQVIKEIPPEKILNLVLKLEELLGFVIDEKR